VIVHVQLLSPLSLRHPAQRQSGHDRNEPRAALTDVDTQQIRRKPVLGGLINEYTHAA